FLSKHKSLKKLKFQHFHTIKDDGAVSRLKFVRMGKDVQQYGLAIRATMLNNDITESESYKMFILYSTRQIPLKKNRGKGSQGKKTADTTEESVDVSDESDPEPLIRRKTSRRKVVKKKPPYHVSKKRTSGTSQKLKGIQSLIPAEQEAADIMKALKDSKKIIGRRPGTGGSDEGTVKDAEKTVDITKETTEQPLTSSSFSVPSDYGNQFLNLSHDEESNMQPPVLQQTTPTRTTIPTPPINTEAPAITTAIPEITLFIAL
ncbi:hypothetical protein Tco_0324477, partial [Tanacetum coccineum]